MSELSPELRSALASYITALADDELLLGHRASEWTGLGPVLEADIALSSIAQDELGHAQTFYGLLPPLNGQQPDALAFQRPWTDFLNAQFSELPRGDWGFTLIRHYLHDVAEQHRLGALAQSGYQPLAAIARKLLPEEKYHLIHGQSWIRRLAGATEESHARMQAAVDQAFPYALGLWEPVEGEAALVEAGLVPASEALRPQWQAEVTAFLTAAGLHIPHDAEPVLGGRQGHHQPSLEALVEALQLVARIAPPETW